MAHINAKNHGVLGEFFGETHEEEITSHLRVHLLEDVACDLVLEVSCSSVG